jgi:hypothetical protein
MPAMRRSLPQKPFLKLRPAQGLHLGSFSLRLESRGWQYDALSAVSAGIYLYLFAGLVQAFAHLVP